MHSFRSSRHLIQLRLAAFCLIALTVVAIGALATGAYALIHVDPEFLKICFSCVCVVVALALLYRIMAGSASCPLCRNQPLISKHCQKHRKAKQLFGSYRYRVAAAVLFSGRFRCPYCGESTACRLSQRHQNSSYQNLSPR